TIFGTTVEENYDLIKDVYIQLEPFKDRKAGDLSGGMKQKLALCCALIHKPKVLFLDEPTTGVDAVSRQEFWQMLKKLQHKEITILVSTPYMDEASLCDRIALLDKGKILKIDTPKAIIQNFDKKVYNVSAEKTYKLLIDLENYTNQYSVFPFGEFVHYMDKQEKVNMEELRKYLLNKGNKNVTIHQTTPTIEDVFMDLMTGV
ncbi:MAG TPA: ABC transporter ATP-binding protein, partial [Flavobacteriia bacterium]|nr:ABC transporter ATP-binding protein [Flavobacteriia bacterium]